MKIGMIQMDAANGCVERNISRGFQLLEEAATQSDVLVMPELWTIGYNFHHFGDHVLSLSDGLIEKLSSFAAYHQVTLVAGTLPIRKKDGVRNMGLVFDSSGHWKATYSKRHLFQGYLEGQLMVPGKKCMTTTIHDVKMGMAICYELYFPKMYRKMAKSGATLVVVPASWPLEHVSQWKVLARARAIENGICICAVNMTGTYHDKTLGGHSLFIDPLGHIVVEGDQKEGIFYADYDSLKYSKKGRYLSVVSEKRYGE